MNNKTHLALYRKWRSQTFDTVYGQEHITSVLKYECANSLVSHAYLFCGSRGTGKTSCAKILAKAVNCLNPQEGNPCGLCSACRSIDSGSATDVLEMDAASNNGVDNIRDIRDEVAYSPSDLKYRVYIIDEVHMLSGSAFNALLKTLEEPPAHAIFILATTELHKLPATIISRCQRFDFRRIPTTVIAQHLERIAAAESIDLEHEAAYLLARLAQGGMRDAISLLELCAGSRRKIDARLVSDTVGTLGRERVGELVRAIADSDCNTILDIIAEIYSSSKDIAVFWQDLISFYRDMLVMKTTPDASKYLDLTDAEAGLLRDISGRFTRETLLSHSRLLDETLTTLQRSGSSRRACAELALLRMSDSRLDSSNEGLLSRVARLEDMLRSGRAENQTYVFDRKPEQQRPAEAASKKHENISLAEDSAESAPDVIENTAAGEISGDKSEKISEKAGKSDKPTSAPRTDATAKNTPPDEGKRVLRSIRSWVEIIGSISRTSQPLAALLNGSRAYLDPDGKVIIRFENSFAIFMIERDKSKDIIRSTLISELGRDLRESDIIFEEQPKEKPAADDETIFDELEKNNN